MSTSTECLVPAGKFIVSGRSGGPLDGMTFVAKDLFDVAGYPTGAGNPDWARTHPVPGASAWVVEKLLEAGATLVGKSVTDEISLGLLGENAFDGVPLNPRAPDRVPGGSSSGSASAVAQGFCDFALGTDTGGSVRVPASFCGLYGIRPTHGRISTQGMVAQAPSSDTAGWLARDAATFVRVGEVLLQETISERLPNNLVVAADAFAFTDPRVGEALRQGLERLTRLIGKRRDELLAPQGLSTWAKAQRTLQQAEAWGTFRDWVEAETPRFSFLVAQTLMFGASVSQTDLSWAALMRDEVKGRMAYLTPPGTILCLPTTPCQAPLKGLPLADKKHARGRITCLVSHGGLSGHPQVSLPLGEVDGAPVGLSIVGARGADMDLIAVARALEEAL